MLGVGCQLRIETWQVKRDGDKSAELIAELEPDWNRGRECEAESDVGVGDVRGKWQGVKCCSFDAGQRCVREVSEFDLDAGTVWDLDHHQPNASRGRGND